MRPPLPREISRLTSHGRINARGSVCTPVHTLMFETKSNYIQDTFIHTRNCYFSFLQAAKENDILKAILTNPEKRFSLTYDTIDYNVTEVELKWTVLVDFRIAFLKVSPFHCYFFKIIKRWITVAQPWIHFFSFHKDYYWTSQLSLFASIMLWEAHFFPAR